MHEPPVDPTWSRELFLALHSKSTRSVVFGVRVALLVAAGKSADEIADLLGVSHEVVVEYVHWLRRMHEVLA